MKCHAFALVGAKRSSDPKAGSRRRDLFRQGRTNRAGAGRWSGIPLGHNRHRCGATGVGIAVDAASRDYSVLLLEQSDFGKAHPADPPSSSTAGCAISSKAISRLCAKLWKNEHCCCTMLPMLLTICNSLFRVPVGGKPSFYGTGLKLYDWLAGQHNLGKSRQLKRSQVQAHISNAR